VDRPVSVDRCWSGGLFFVLDWRQGVECGVEPHRVVERLDVVEDRPPCFGTGALGDGVVVGGPAPIEISMSALRQRSPKIKETYCKPWSEWWTGAWSWAAACDRHLERVDDELCVGRRASTSRRPDVSSSRQRRRGTTSRPLWGCTRCLPPRAGSAPRTRSCARRGRRPHAWPHLYVSRSHADGIHRCGRSTQERRLSRAPRRAPQPAWFPRGSDGARGRARPSTGRRLPIRCHAPRAAPKPSLR